MLSVLLGKVRDEGDYGFNRLASALVKWDVFAAPEDHSVGGVGAEYKSGVGNEIDPRELELERLVGKGQLQVWAATLQSRHW